MTTAELSQRLYQEGCNPLSYAIGSRGAASDAFCLTFDGAEWQVYYTERGQDYPPIYRSDSESQACEFFFQHIMSIRHDHCIGIFRSKEHADALYAKLQQLGIEPWRDQIPYGGPADMRFRVFVTGKAVFRARAEVGAVPVSD